MNLSKLAFTALFATVILASVSNALAGNIVVTVNGTVATASAGMGYTVGQPVAFSWVVNDYSPQTPEGSVDSEASFKWTQENQGSEPSLWANVGGTGISGTFNEAPANIPWESLEVGIAGQDTFEVMMNTDSFNTTTNNHGIYLTADSSYLIRTLHFYGEIESPFPGASFVEPLPNPTTYLGGYLGTYNFVDQVVARLDANNGTTTLSATFTANSVSIAPVPEPSTCMMALAGLASGGYLVRRRRTRA